MKITFICGSLEPGRDGVGDYTRRLAGELSQKGHEVSAVAVNDAYVNEVFRGYQTVENNSLQVLRLPSEWPAKKRFNEAKEWIDMLNAEWLSLQYVPFSFHLKGLPFGLSKSMAEFGKGRSWHVMFHELWVGMNAESSVKLICWGWLQRHLIKNLITGLHPKVIHTQTRLYQAQLAKFGFEAEYLPLFTNIPQLYPNRDSFSIKQMNPKTISFVHFGTIHPGASIELLAKEASMYVKKKGIPIILTIIGRCGNEVHNWTSTWRSAGLQVELLGEQSADQISKILSKASIGIATTPIATAEKSGSVAAMWEHKLPVLCISRPWTPRDIKNLQPSSGITEYRYGGLETFLNEKQIVPNTCKLSDVSQQLTNNLLKAV